MKILTFTTLYPNAVQSTSCIFVENRLRHLLELGNIEACVVAPVPWFPFRHRVFGRYSDFARVPPVEERHGINIWHPKYLVIPKFGLTIAPLLLAIATYPVLKKLRREGYDFDLIDAHFFYPDGVAAALLGKWLNRPITITARGTDLNLYPRFRLPRKMIRWAAEKAAGLITVCEALKGVLVELGVPEKKVVPLRNGVDLELFQPPKDRGALRDRLKLKRPTLLSVGHLITRKGHDIVIRALKHLPDVDVVIVGDGPERGRLNTLAREMGILDRVRFVPPMRPMELREYYGAADALVLASSREGWANVLLEALACGTPVIASKVWGSPEVVRAPEAGVLMEERTPDALAAAWQHLSSNYPDRNRTHRYAEGFGWGETSQGQHDLFTHITDKSSEAG